MTRDEFVFFLSPSVSIIKYTLNFNLDVKVFSEYFIFEWYHLVHNFYFKYP